MINDENLQSKKKFQNKDLHSRSGDFYGPETIFIMGILLLVEWYF